MIYLTNLKTLNCLKLIMECKDFTSDEKTIIKNIIITNGKGHVSVSRNLIQKMLNNIPSLIFIECVPVKTIPDGRFSFTQFQYKKYVIENKNLNFHIIDENEVVNYL